MSPETDSTPPFSPPASLFEPATSSIRAATGAELKENKRKRIKSTKLPKEKKAKKANQRIAVTRKTELTEPEKKHNEMAFVVRLMVEQEEKDEGELEKGRKTRLK